MRIETSKILSAYIEKQIDTDKFEEWIYSSQDLEGELGVDIYTDLISINFKGKSARIEVEKLVDSKINYAELHKEEIIKLITQIEFKQIDLIEGISQLHKLSELGYNFLGRIDLIGNFGEQGKSIVHHIDSSKSNDLKWDVLKSVDPNFIYELLEVRNKIQKGIIILTGEKETFQFIGKQYKYIEK